MNSTQDHRFRQGAKSIAEGLERDILDGSLAEGSRLPAIRVLADQLDVSPTTVAAAYQTLRNRGLVVASRRGTLVAPFPALAPRLEASLPSTVRDLESGNPDPALLPPLGTLDTGGEPLLYGESQNLEALVELARSIYSADGIPSDHVAIVGGSHDGIERALSAYLRPGDKVAVEDPGYVGAYDLLRAMGLELVPVNMDQQGPVTDSMAEAVGVAVDAAIITVRAQNPTGAVLTLDRARELSALFDTAPDLLVLEDDHAGPVSGAPVSTTVNEDRRRWSIVRSVGKFLAPDLRVALMTGDMLTMARLEARQLVGTGWVSQMLQRLVADNWHEPAVVHALATAESAYRERREALLTQLDRHGISGEASSGWNVWVPVRHETPVVQGMRDRGFAIAAGESFRISARPAVRITASGLEPDEAALVAAALAEVLGRGASRAV